MDLTSHRGGREQTKPYTRILYSESIHGPGFCDAAVWCMTGCARACALCAVHAPTPQHSARVHSQPCAQQHHLIHILLFFDFRSFYVSSCNLKLLAFFVSARAALFCGWWEYHDSEPSSECRQYLVLKLGGWYNRWWWGKAGCVVCGVWCVV